MPSHCAGPFVPGRSMPCLLQKRATTAAVSSPSRMHSSSREGSAVYDHEDHGWGPTRLVGGAAAAAAAGGAAGDAAPNENRAREAAANRNQNSLADFSSAIFHCAARLHTPTLLLAIQIVG